MEQGMLERTWAIKWENKNKINNFRKKIPGKNKIKKILNDFRKRPLQLKVLVEYEQKRFV